MSQREQMELLPALLLQLLRIQHLFSYILYTEWRNISVNGCSVTIPLFIMQILKTKTSMKTDCITGKEKLLSLSGSHGCNVSCRSTFKLTTALTIPQHSSLKKETNCTSFRFQRICNFSLLPTSCIPFSSAESKALYIYSSQLEKIIFLSIQETLYKLGICFKESWSRAPSHIDQGRHDSSSLEIWIFCDFPC